MVLSHDPHRGLDELAARLEQVSSSPLSSFEGSPSAEALANHAGIGLPSSAAIQQLRQQYEEDIGGHDNATQLAPSNSQTNNLDRKLAFSWLFIMLLAPIIVVLLIWLLVLLRRRLGQTRHLVSFGTYLEAPQRPQDQQHQRQPARRSRSARGHYLLDSSSSSASSSSLASSSSSSLSEQRRLENGRLEGSDSCSTSSPQTSPKFRPELNAHASACLSSMRSLIEHTNLYLITLTYQEIIGCSVAFTVAILNIVRMRNLFGCNLVIFVLITSKLLSLFTLFTFSLTKLVKLSHLRPLITTSEQQGLSKRAPKLLEPLELPFKRPITSSPSSTKTTTSTPRATTSQALRTSTCNAVRAEAANVNGANNKAQRRRNCSSPSFEAANTTICRLIVKEDSASDQRPADSPTRFSSASASSSSTLASMRAEAGVGRPSAKEEPAAACRLLLLVFASALTALLCLYLRMMGPSQLIMFDHQRSSSGNGGNYSQHLSHILGAATTTTTTEASTRYSSPSPLSSSSSSGEQAKPDFQASWAPVRFEQSSWQLKQLLEQLELQQFIHLLLDTHLQTSQFACSLSSSQYAPAAKLSMLVLYSALVSATFCLLVAIRRVGGRKLRQFHESMALAAAAGSRADHCCAPLLLLSQHQQPKQQQQRVASQLKLTDSHRRRYSDLLKQSMRYQSSLELGEQRRRRQTGSGRCGSAAGRPLVGASSRKRLRNSSSLSSLLAPTTSSGCIRWSVQHNQQQQRNHHQHHQLDALRLATGSGERQFRRLVTAHSLANLPTRGCSPAASKVPAGKLANSSGQLAWLPLGSAATVASLSNIGHFEGQQRGTANVGSELSAANRPDQQQQRGKLILNSIGEHLMLDERDEEALTSIAEFHSSYRINADNNTDNHQASESSSSNNKAGRSAKGNGQSKRPLYSNQHHQQQQHHQASETTAKTGEIEIERLQQQQQQLLQKHQHLTITRGRLLFAELKRDLRLAQSVVLFGQLLNHAPILLLLALANFLPDGLFSSPPGLAGWNSSHDNGFIWLSLIEALALPFLLCSLDSRLNLALRRSLSCSKGGRQQQQQANESRFRFQTADEMLDHQRRLISKSKLAPPAFGAGRQLAGGSSAKASEAMVLGPSASYPDFMFGLAGSGSGSGGPQQQAANSTTCPLDYALRLRPQDLNCSRSKTGPPYVASKSSRHHQELAIETCESLLAANFALASRQPIDSGQTTDCRLIGTADLMASRRARYSELLSALDSSGRRRVSAAASGRQQQQRRRGQRSAAGSALLSVTRRLFRFRRPQALKGRRRHASSGCLVSHSNSSTAENSNTTGTTGSRLSPTSSLSTLIRKFNHDNYTSVCQQYDLQRRKQQQRQQKQQQQGLEPAATPTQVNEEQVLIEGLNGTIESKTEEQQEILCRKGGLYYNYLLDDKNNPSANSSGKLRISRVNPLMLSDASRSSSAAVGRQAAEVASGAKRQAQNCDILLEVFSGTELPERREAESGGAKVAVAVSERAQGLPGQQQQQQQQQQQLARQVTNVNKSKSAQKQQTDVVELMKRTQSSQSVASASATRTSAEGSATRSKKNKALSSKLLQQSVLSKHQVDEQSIGQIGVRLIGAAKSSPAAATAIPTPGPNAATANADVAKPTAASALDPERPGGNNETIIGNITSVQELLNKMNGIIMGEQVEGGRGGLAGNRATADDGGASSRSAKNACCRSNRTILGLLTKNNNNANEDKQNCANHLRQLNPPMGKQANVVYDSSIQRTPMIANAHQQDWSGSTLTNNNNNTLDYATLRSMDDALSLVSVSSEFEYHNITSPTAGLPLDCLQRPEEAVSEPIKRWAQSRLSGLDCAPTATNGGNNNHPSTCSSADHRPRFPSFMASREPANHEQRQTSAERLPPRIKQQQQQAKAGSSSLLNLTAAKFAAINTNAGAVRSMSNQQQQQQQLVRLPTKTSLSSSTITKQRGGAAATPREVTLGEFGASSTGASLSSAGSQQQQLPESSLPVESGNVRARIRKMEQQQSTPNLSNNSPNSSQLSGSKSRLSAVSMIPVMSGSRMPQAPVADKTPQTRQQQQLMGATKAPIRASSRLVTAAPTSSTRAN